MGKSTARPKQQSMVEIDNLRAMYSVADSSMNWNTTLYEKQFNAKPFRILSNRSRAIVWAADQLSIVE
jgi:hypothetical protein